MDAHSAGTLLAPPCPEPDPTGPVGLQAHMQQCTFAAGAAYRLSCFAEDVSAFVAPRLVSVLMLTGLLALAVAMPFTSP